MQSAAAVALALLESASAFQAPAAAMRSVSCASATMFSEGDLGVLPPLGVFDPLGLIETRDMRRYKIMEIKHGRAAMLGFLHVIALLPRRRARAGLPVDVAEPEVRRRAGGLLRLARGRAHRGLAADHGAHLHAGGC